MFRPAARLAGAALAAAMLVPALAACDPPAAEVYARPLTGFYSITGHGWGHGEGMSQWGAEGAASLGVSAGTILDTYYPGTQTAVLPNSPIRVRLTRVASNELDLRPVSGLTVTDGVGRQLVLPAGPSKWRVLLDGAGLHLQRLDATWTTVPVAGATSLAGPVRFTSSTALVSVAYPDQTSRDYRGVVSATQVGSSLVAVDTLGMEDYLRAVVPQEMSPSWLPAALQAQAVAARSYAAYDRSVASSTSPYDVCDSTACQAFGGTLLRYANGQTVPIEYASSDAAIAATAGQIRTFGGRPAVTMFSSSNGGWSVAGGAPYLVSKPDPWDGTVANSMHTWHAVLPVSAIEQHFPAVGHLLRLRVVSRDGNGDWGGRVVQVVLEGVDAQGKPTSVTTTGNGIYLARVFGSYSDGLRSNWWHVDP